MILSHPLITNFLFSRGRKPQPKQGFTLIELLVVIIIIGILSAIALPTLLTQVSRSRQAEAKVLLGTINRSQQTYRFRNGVFANDINLLEISVPAEYYSYSVDQANGSTSVTHQAIAEPTYDQDLKDYASGVYYFPNNKLLSTIICEANTITSGASASININVADCNADSTKVK